MSPCLSGTLLDELVPRLPIGLAFLHSPIADMTACLYPEENCAIQRAVDRRRFEFSTGRWLARQGMRRLGEPASAVPCGPAREPCWPPGIVASLSHSASNCALVMGRREQYRGIGLDLELSDAPKDDLARLIVSPTEPREYCRGAMLRLVFSAKESIYKCLYPITGLFVDFHHIEVVFDHHNLTFTGRSLDKAAPPELLEAGAGQFRATETGALTLFTIPEGGRTKLRQMEAPF